MISLELGEGGHDVQHERVLRGEAKFRRSDDHESDLETPKLIEQRRAITNAPRHPIEAVNEDLIDLAAANKSKQSVQRRTIERRLQNSRRRQSARAQASSRALAGTLDITRTPRTGRRTTTENPRNSPTGGCRSRTELAFGATPLRRL